MVTGILVALQVLFAFGTIVLVLMHSGKDAGLSGVFGVGQAQAGATQVMERNLTRLTVVVASLMVATTIALGFVL